MRSVADYQLECVTCGRVYRAAAAPAYVCTACAATQTPGAPLRGVLACRYDYAAFAARHARRDARTAVLLPLPSAVPRLLAVGNTPLYDAPRLARRAGVRRVALKDETVEPTHSLKDRASWLVVQMALAQGHHTLVCASTGNAAGSLAAMCAAAHLECHLYVSSTAPHAKLVQLRACGAILHCSAGSYDELFEASLQATRAHGWYNRNTAYNPWTIEGKKTAAWELAWQSDFELPEYVVVPTGDGVILAGIHKGFHDLLQLGWIERMPRLVAVQPAGASALVAAWDRGSDGSDAIGEAASVADSLVVRAPRNAILALRALRTSGGYAVRVTDHQILAALRDLGMLTGIFVETAAAAAWAGLCVARAQGLLTADASVALLLTGSGLKDVNAARKALEQSRPGEPDDKGPAQSD